MKKRILSLIMMGMLVVPMVGCNANIKILGKEVVLFRIVNMVNN